MRTTLDLPDDVLRLAKAEAALAGTSLTGLVAEARRDYLEGRANRGLEPCRPGWRSVFGAVPREVVEEVDRTIDAELEQIDPEDWR